MSSKRIWMALLAAVAGLAVFALVRPAPGPSDNPEDSAFSNAGAGARKERDKAFAAAAAGEAGATRLPSGLVIQVLIPGSGASPKASDIVKINYEGKLSDGKVFDSSWARHKPAQFPLSAVIRCWREGIVLMKVGETARLTCPSALAYGDRGYPPSVPGGATLSFKIELLEINPAAPGSGTTAAIARAAAVPPKAPDLPPGIKFVPGSSSGAAFFVAAAEAPLPPGVIPPPMFLSAMSSGGTPLPPEAANLGAVPPELSAPGVAFDAPPLPPGVVEPKPWVMMGPGGGQSLPEGATLVPAAPPRLPPGVIPPNPMGLPPAGNTPGGIVMPAPVLPPGVVLPQNRPGPSR